MCLLSVQSATTQLVVRREACGSEPQNKKIPDLLSRLFLEKNISLSICYLLGFPFPFAACPTLGVGSG